MEFLCECMNDWEEVENKRVWKSFLIAYHYNEVLKEVEYFEKF